MVTRSPTLSITSIKEDYECRSTHLNVFLTAHYNPFSLTILPSFPQGTSRFVLSHLPILSHILFSWMMGGWRQLEAGLHQRQIKNYVLKEDTPSPASERLKREKSMMRNKGEIRYKSVLSDPAQ